MTNETLVDKIDKELNEKLKQISDFTVGRPRFLKPTYFLQDRSTYLDVQIKIGTKLIPLLPPGDTGYGVNDLSQLNKDQIYGAHSILKNFSYDAIKMTVSVTIGDVNQKLIELLAIDMQSLAAKIVPTLRIDYGWFHPKDKDSRDGLRNMKISDYLPLDDDEYAETEVYFKRRIWVKLKKVDVKYTDQGALEVTFHCLKDTGFPSPFEGFVPYDAIGANPAMSLQLVHSLNVLTAIAGLINKDLIIGRYKSNPGLAWGSDSTKVEPAIMAYYRAIIYFLYEYKGVKDPSNILHLLKRFTYLFFPTMLDNLVNPTKSCNKAILYMCKKISTLEYYIGSKPGYKKGNEAKAIFFKAIAPFSGTIQESLINLDKESEKDSKKKEESSLNVIKITDKINKIDVKGVLSAREATINKCKELFTIQESKNNIFTVLQNIRELLASGNKAQVSASKQSYTFDVRFALFISTLTTVLVKSQVHPYDVLRFMLHVFKRQLAYLKSTANTYDSLSAEDITKIKSMETYIINGINEKQVGGYTRYEVKDTKAEKAKAISEFKYKNISGHENYLFNVSEFGLKPMTDWNSCFNSIANKIYVWINKDAYKKLNIVVPKETKDEETNKKIEDKKKSIERRILTNDEIDKFKKRFIDSKEKSKQDEAPVKLTAKTLVMSDTEAKDSLNLFKSLLKSKYVALKNAKKPDADLKEREKVITNLQTQINTINKNKSPVIITILEPIPGVNTIFDDGYTKNNVLQAYSYRGGGNLTEGLDGDNTQFNPGYPSSLNINFPDVLAFTPELDFAQLVNAKSFSMNQTMNNCAEEIFSITNKMTMLDEEGKALKETEKKLTSTKKSVSDVKLKIQVNNKNKEELDNQLKKLLQIGRQSSIYQSEVPNEGIDLKNIEDVKRTLQTMRKELIINAVPFNAKIEIIGDPIYDANSVGKYIYLKYINADGSLSIFTGVYTILNGISHVISNGTYSTQLNLKKEVMAGNEQLKNQMESIFASTDDFYVNTK